MNKINKCIDCGVKICEVSKRCRSCAKQGKHHPNYGRKFSLQHRKNISLSQKGKKLSAEHKRKIGLSGKGRKHSLISRKKMSEALLGHKVSIKTRKKMSIIAKKRYKYSTKHHPSYIDGRSTKKYYCIDCEKQLSSYGIKRCRPCTFKFKFKNPKNNPRYIDGRSYLPYPIEFNKDLKYKIRERDSFECQNCDMTEEEHIIVLGQVLHVHHIDYNKFNLEEKNLITLCNFCNTRANLNRKFWQEHYTEKIKEIYNGESTISTSTKPNK